MKSGDASTGKKTRRAAPDAKGAPAVTPAAYLSLGTRPGSTGSTPILAASNAVGSAILSVGVPAAAVASMTPVLPLGHTGIDVHETLHRLDAVAQAPSLERGVSSANRVGEPLAQLTMRWLLAPEGFEARPGAVPPATEFRASASQRFVMQDGAITFQERGHGTLRFFGAGRTYPATTDGQARLFVAGAATIVEGTGSLKGVRGTLMFSGEVKAPSTMALTIVGHLDAGSPVVVEDTLGPLADLAGPAADATVLTLAGESGATGGGHLSVVRVGNDLANATRLRSYVRSGPRVGSASGALTFDPADHRCSVPLAGAARVLAFADGAGRPVGTISAEGLEGTAFPEARDGHVVNRIVAYGAASRGTGALAGAGGVLTFEDTVEPSGRTTTLYTLRLADPTGRFRAAYSDACRPALAPAPEGPPPPAPISSLQFVEGGPALTDTDKTIVSYADRTMGDGVDLLRWWEAKDRNGDYAERFDVMREFTPTDRSFGFFDTAVVNNTGLPVMGIVQEMFYDRQKLATGDLIREQLKAFVLRYFMRVSHVRQPEVAGGEAPRGTIEKMLSWLPDDGERRVGFGYQQLYYKLHGSGRIGKFAKDQQSAIVDLREVGEIYDWILLKVDIFDFNLSFAPMGPDAPKLQVPLKESTYLVLGPSFVKNVDNPEPGVLGRYGFGYAFVPYAPEGKGLIAYGPGHFAAAIQTVDFTVMHDGEVRVRAGFVVNRPTKIANLDVAPVDWSLQMADAVTFGTASKVMSPMKAVADRLPLRLDGVDPISAYIWMANTMSGGLAARRLGISREVLEKRMLVQHFMQHHEMLTNSLLAWRTVADWTDHSSLPAYCHEGIAC